MQLDKAPSQLSCLSLASKPVTLSELAMTSLQCHSTTTVHSWQRSRLLGSCCRAKRPSWSAWVDRAILIFCGLGSRHPINRFVMHACLVCSTIPSAQCGRQSPALLLKETLSTQPPGKLCPQGCTANMTLMWGQKLLWHGCSVSTIRVRGAWETLELTHGTQGGQRQSTDRGWGWRDLKCWGRWVSVLVDQKPSWLPSSQPIMRLLRKWKN